MVTCSSVYCLGVEAWEKVASKELLLPVPRDHEGDFSSKKVAVSVGIY